MPFGDLPSSPRSPAASTISRPISGLAATGPAGFALMGGCDRLRLREWRRQTWTGWSPRRACPKVKAAMPIVSGYERTPQWTTRPAPNSKPQPSADWSPARAHRRAEYRPDDPPAANRLSNWMKEAAD
jgi:hypothetical protein